MTTNSPQSYRETQILTATPQRLRLMLIEGALRLAHHALAAWEDGRSEEAYQAVVHCREIVLELLNGIDQRAGDVAAKVAGVYGFLYRSLALANLLRDPAHVRDAVRVLEEERVTWQLVCEAMPEAPPGWKRPRTSGVITDTEGAAVPTHRIDPYSGTVTSASPPASADRLSLEA